MCFFVFDLLFVLVLMLLGIGLKIVKFVFGFVGLDFDRDVIVVDFLFYSLYSVIDWWYKFGIVYFEDGDIVMLDVVIDWYMVLFWYFKVFYKIFVFDDIGQIMFVFFYL